MKCIHIHKHTRCMKYKLNIAMFVHDKVRKYKDEIMQYQC